MSRGLRRALLRAEPGEELFLLFENPLESHVTEEPGEVAALLARAEAAAARGLWAVGFVGYEAAPAFDAALVAHAPAGPAPLASFAFFEAPSERTLAREMSAARVAEAEPSWQEGEHAARVESIREAIASGSTYQVNLVFPFAGRFEGAPFDLFASVLAPGEAPYAALLEGDGWALVSLSPELFFEREPRDPGAPEPARIVMRPMKGTRARGRFGAEDRRLARELAASGKDRAENLMIVDMVRNDLGRVAEVGSVEVESRFEVERYPTVWQMTSTVAASSEARLPGLFGALFPCASVTGAPKAATMRIIRELESEPRGAYCGAIGSLAPSGRARFAVAIRTLELDLARSSFRYGVGSGITWESEPAAEWRECLDKARVLGGAPPEFELIETMRWRPDQEMGGIELLDLHLERLADSAAYFGFAPAGDDSEKAGKARAFMEGELRRRILAHCASLPPSHHRLRLLQARNGAVRIESEPFEPESRAWSVAVAAQSFHSMDVFAFHKTTHRVRYERARSSAPSEADEVLLVNENGELTEGTRTNLFLDFGTGWVTPPRTSGLLGGVFRERLLRSGQVAEATLYPRDLARAHRIRLGNALRGWIAVGEVFGIDRSRGAG